LNVKIQFVAAAAAVAIALAAGVALRSASSLGGAPVEASRERQEPRGAVTPAAGIDVEKRATIESIQEVRSSARSSKLVAEFRSSKDWRAFALAAKSRPEEGGYFYAMYASNLCGMGVARMPQMAQQAVASTVAATGTVAPKVMELSERLLARCASFAEGEAASIYRETKESAANDRDPIVTARRKVSAALGESNTELVKETFGSLFMLDDPLAPYTDALLLRAMSKSAGRAGETWFDGTVYGADDPTKLSSLRLATDLAGCTGDLPCELDTQMMLGCLGGQFCTDDREDYLRQQYVRRGGMSKAQFAEALALSNRIRRAVGSGQVEAFVR
jgi:hypothetical protein